MTPVVALIRAKPGKENDLEAMLRTLVPLTRKEAGCHTYNLYRDAADPRLFVFVESWRSVEDLQAHLGSAHIKAGMARKDELIELLEIKTLLPVIAEG